MTKPLKEKLNFTHYKGLLSDFDTLKVTAVKSGAIGRIHVRKVEAVLNTREHQKGNRNRNIVTKIFGFKENQMEIVIDNGVSVHKTKLKTDEWDVLRESIQHRNTLIGYEPTDKTRKLGYRGLTKELDEHYMSLLVGLDNLKVSKDYMKNVDIIVTIQRQSATTHGLRIQIKNDYLDIRKLNNLEVISTTVEGVTNVYITPASNEKDINTIMRRFICDCKAPDIARYTTVQEVI